MKQVAKQLEAVRRRGRRLLVIQRLLQGWNWAVPVVISAGLLDFLLRLPGWLRLVLGLAALAFGGFVLVRRVGRAIGFNPSLSELATRVEGLYPALVGQLSSALEFGTQPGRYAKPAGTAAMAQASVRRAERDLAGVRFGRLIDTGPTRKVLGFSLVALLVLASLVAAAPMHSAIAARRWVAPLGDTAWPRRTHVEPLPVATVRPVDTPVEFTARVEQGMKSGMRVWLHTRWVRDPSQPLNEHDAERFGGVESQLMTEQLASLIAPENESQAADTQGIFKAQWRVPPDIARRIETQRWPMPQLEYWYEAGDHATQPQRVTLVARPRITAVVAQTRPPHYAAGLVATQTVNLQDQAQRVVTLPQLAGSAISLKLSLNKPLPDESLTTAALVPGLASVSGVAIDRPDPLTVVLNFTLSDSVQTLLQLRDEHGLTDHDQRTIRFEKIEDQMPTAVLTEPSADVSVLPTAVLPVSARASDDVGLRLLVVSAVRDARESDGSPALDKTLDEREGRQPELGSTSVLSLEALNVKVGDSVTLNAAATDVFDLNGKQHEPRFATPRRLRIIDAATLIEQVRGDLAGVRQQAVRLERQQAELNKRSKESSAQAMVNEQARVSRSLDAQSRQLESLAERLELNRLNEAALDQLIDQADALVERAAAESRFAEQRLRESAEQNPEDPEAEPAAAAQAEQTKKAAQGHQETAREKLDELAKLLDQGGDALGLKLDLARLRAEQENLAQDTRELLPQTVGKPMDELSDAEKQALRDLAERQAALSEQAEDTVERIQKTAEGLAKQSESDADRATAQALAEAAAMARRQGLSEQMQEAQEQTEQNQLSQAGQSQMSSLDTLDQMMQKMGEQDQLKQELLKRRLLQLAQKIQKLIEAQEAELATLERAEAEALPRLGEVMGKLWVRTVAAQTEAESDESTVDVAPLLGEAAKWQAAAIASLRAADAGAAGRQEREALTSLRDALEKVNEKKEQAEKDKADEARAELRGKYLELAERQGGLIEQVTKLSADFPPTRKDRAELRGVGGEQNTLREEAQKLGEQVADTMVFKQTHKLIDQAATRAGTKLGRGIADAPVNVDQARVKTLLESMADALDDSGDNSEFAQNESSGGEGGGGGEPPLIPPVAELKLLRGVQQAIYDETRALGEAMTGGPNPDQADRLGDLSTQQAELSEIGQRLIEQIQQRNQATPNNPG